MIEGYIGAQPKPVTTRPISAGSTELTGRIIRSIPKAMTASPILISFLSPSLSDTKPLKNLPRVIPR